MAAMGDDVEAGTVSRPDHGLRQPHDRREACLFHIHTNQTKPHYAEALGQGGLYEIDQFNRRCELGIALGRANWGKGFGQDAVVLVCSPMGGTTVIRWLGDSRFLRSSEAAYPAGMHSHAQPADPTTSIRDQLNSWDFIGVFDAEKNGDEYDCLVEPLLSMLKCGKGECPAEWWALGVTGAAAEM